MHLKYILPWDLLICNVHHEPIRLFVCVGAVAACADGTGTYLDAPTCAAVGTALQTACFYNSVAQSCAPGTLILWQKGYIDAQS